jgi:asparagine synthase (glutamine-hydrolysing)
MSAIFGIFQRNGTPLPPGVLEAARQDLAHHARDGSATWQPEGGVAFGYAATWLTPESQAEIQPFYDQSAQLAITADARLDNRAELAHLLDISSPELATLPDSRLILRAYLAWGEACPERLLGDFTFAIWDARQAALFCARDPLGIRPFVYYTGAQRFAFASDMAGLLALMDEAPQLDVDFVAAWMRGWQDIHIGRTFYANAPKLPPGHALRVSADGLRTWAYWQPEDAPQIRYASHAEYAEALHDLFKQVVEDRLRCAYPLGAHLSGGLDSSSIAILAGRKLHSEGRDLAVFSWSPPSPAGETLIPSDERHRVAAICKAEGFQPHYVQATPQDDCFLETCDPSILPEETLRREYAVMQQAARLNLRLILSGWGGDELISFNGRGYLPELLLHGRLRRLGSQLFYRAHGKPKALAASLYREVLMPLLPPALDARMPLRYPKPPIHTLPSQAQGLMRQQLAQHKNLGSGELPAAAFFQPDFYRRLQAAGDPPHTSGRTVPGVYATQLALFHNGHIFARIDSWSAHAARFGLQYSYPLLDRRVVEFALGVPSDLYMEKGQGRHLMRLALEGILPSELIWDAPKFEPTAITNQKTPQHKAETQRLRQSLVAELRARQPRSADWIDFDYLNRILETQPDQRAHGETPGIWQVLSLAFLDPRAR